MGHDDPNKKELKKNFAGFYHKKNFYIVFAKIFTDIDKLTID